jgi:hypothetical protein
MDNETRTHPRVRGTAGAELSCGEGKFACRAFNLSVAGCYVETRHSLCDPTVDLLLRVPSHREAISCAAAVVRKDIKRDGTVCLALRFLSLDWTELLGLARLVSPQLQ